MVTSVRISACARCLRAITNCIPFTALIALSAVLASDVHLTSAADAPPSKPAQAVPKAPSSIFDFGLDPLPNTDPDKDDKSAPPAAQQPAPSPAPADVAPPPVRPPAKPPQDKPAPSVTKTPAPKDPSHGGSPKPALTPEIQAILDKCHVDAQGVITSDAPVTLGLHGTEGAHFVVSGEFYPAAEPTRSNDGGLGFLLRSSSGKKRIELSINGMRVKRVMLEGAEVKKFANPMKFDGIEREKWHTFKIDAGPDAIIVHFDDQEGTAKGPVETKGTNSITLAPGAKLRHLQITILN